MILIRVTAELGRTEFGRWKHDRKRLALRFELRREENHHGSNGGDTQG
jgi:hypothetical protein